MSFYLPSVSAQLTDESGRDQLRRMSELGAEFDTAEALYNHLRQEADGGQGLPWDNLPDWRGIYTRAAGGLKFDPNQSGDVMTSARLTPEYLALYRNKLKRLENEIEYDPLSQCNPPGYPRWLTEPFLREFIVTPDQTWLVNEMVNDIRRVYTDGRGHTPPEDAYPLYNGDSIGFWDGHRLVTHTSQLMSGQYQRGDPFYSDQVETVEVWEKVDDTTIEASTWIFDPPALEEPWFVKQYYAKLDNPDQFLRIRYWHCGENQNNDVFMTEDGASQFRDFDFTEMDD